MVPPAPHTRTNDLTLRDVIDDDLPVFFNHQLDPEANRLAAFTRKDPADRDAFHAHWTRILEDASDTTRTILFDGQVAGHVLSYEEAGRTEVSYWLGREYWGKGIATSALSQYLEYIAMRPIHARAAKDNIPSLRVLQKCGFAVIGEDKGFSNARGMEVEEYLLELKENVQ